MGFKEDLKRDAELRQQGQASYHFKDRDNPVASEATDVMTAGLDLGMDITSLGVKPLIDSMYSLLATGDMIEGNKQITMAVKQAKQADNYKNNPKYKELVDEFEKASEAYKKSRNSGFLGSWFNKVVKFVSMGTLNQQERIEDRFNKAQENLENWEKQEGERIKTIEAEIAGTTRV